ncbi:hypothetical protein SLS60_004324 [Paraconiothyrium brasiliense]|uniref:Major facilitator superfamily (MFS) profile domain-containing protein n=1 Tax=Paraconiothyrium brasiliense TaxID=300254 RepID=A0ABR3RKX1_9PLEO
MDSTAEHHGEDKAAPVTDATKVGTTAEESSVKDTTVEEKAATDDNPNYITGARLGLIIASLMLGVFCVALDNNIVAVAIPRITNEFHTLNHVGWYGSAYLLPGCGFQLLFGKLYTLFRVKWVFLSGLFLFELGSLICGVAPNSVALIIGRAIAGIGSSGLFTGAMMVIAHTIPLQKRPAYMGMTGGVYGIASVVGPLIGGAFTDKATWRWCFYINLPLGGLTAAGILFLLQLNERAGSNPEPLAVTVKKLDPIGTLMFVPSVVCLLLALQWGGVQYPWSDGRVIALLVVFGISFLAFIALQIFLGDNATVPARIATQRTILFACIFNICVGGSFFILSYYIPIWFQVVKNVSAIKSGIYFLPFIIPEIVAVMASGGIVTATGYYNPLVILGTVLMSIGAGLCTLFNLHTPQAQWVGYQFIFGFGVGIGFQQGAVAAQNVLPMADVATGTALVLFFQIFGGAVFVAVAQNLLASSLVEKLVALDIPGLSPDVIVKAGVTHLRELVGPEFLPQVLVAYNASIVQTFRLALVLACVSLIGALGMEWKSVKKQGAEQQVAEKQDGEN